VDLVLEEDFGLVAVEVKYTSTAGGICEACGILRPSITLAWAWSSAMTSRRGTAKTAPSEFLALICKGLCVGQGGKIYHPGCARFMRKEHRRMQVDEQESFKGGFSRAKGAR
jgi:hypothetical protein